MKKVKSKEIQQSFAGQIVKIGLFGGLFWGFVWYFFYIFSFTDIGPNYFLLPLAFGEWKKEWIGQLIGICIMSILSIGTAALFGSLFKRFQGILPGIVYGMVWWCMLFFGVSMFSPVIKHVWEFPKETIVTTVCIFIIYGVFIAYSVSFEASMQNLVSRKRERNYSNE
ncbi:YqhR family membrane protein [Ectobacillus polymachus]|uniref:YqhR family membrane protein n=1 Tax=Ectobacillus polymachus TaxID=1508806 RepID=UPI003A8BC4D7